MEEGDFPSLAPVAVAPYWASLPHLQNTKYHFYVNMCFQARATNRDGDSVSETWLSVSKVNTLISST